MHVDVGWWRFCLQAWLVSLLIKAKRHQPRDKDGCLFNGMSHEMRGFRLLVGVLRCSPIPLSILLQGPRLRVVHYTLCQGRKHFWNTHGIRRSFFGSNLPLHALIAGDFQKL